MAKNNKKKITYIDDGRTIADMSGLDSSKGKKKEKSSIKTQWQTYWDTVKMMFIPMLITLGIIAVAFGILYILL